MQRLALSRRVIPPRIVNAVLPLEVDASMSARMEMDVPIPNHVLAGLLEAHNVNLHAGDEDDFATFDDVGVEVCIGGQWGTVESDFESIGLSVRTRETVDTSLDDTDEAARWLRAHAPKSRKHRLWKPLKGAAA